MRKVLNFYERWFTRALNSRLYLLLACLLLVAGIGLLIWANRRRVA